MATVGNVQLIGFDKLERKFLALPKAVQGKIARPALRSGAKIIHAEAVQNAPERTGRIKRGIKVRAGKRSRTGPSVNVQLGKGNFQGDEFYGAFVEFGHKIGKRAKGLNRKNNPTQDTRTKEVPGQHFMKRAAEQKGQEALHLVASQMGDGIVREMSK